MHGFDWMLAASVAASLSSSALCFMGLEMNDHRRAADALHASIICNFPCALGALPAGLSGMVAEGCSMMLLEGLETKMR